MSPQTTVSHYYLESFPLVEPEEPMETYNCWVWVKDAEEIREHAPSKVTLKIANYFIIESKKRKNLELFN